MTIYPGCGIFTDGLLHHYTCIECGAECESRSRFINTCDPASGRPCRANRKARAQARAHAKEKAKRRAKS